MISKDEKQLLDDMLKNSSPVLFLGAGFSIGSKNQNDNFDAQGLRGYIFNKLVIGKAEESDIEEIKGYNLRRLCEYVYSLYGGKKNLQICLHPAIKE